MRGLVGCIIGAIIGGIVGAALWAAITNATNREIGWIAWGVGGLVGLGARLGARDWADTLAGIVAALVAIVALAGGKYLVVQIAVDSAAKDVISQIESNPIGETEAKAFMAGDLVTQAESAGKKLKWPDGKSLDNAESFQDFPKSVQTDVESRWKGMTPDAQTAYIESVKAHSKHMSKQAVASISDQVSKQGFIESFSLFDLLWFGLAIMTAFKIGTGFGGDDD